jgi:hypothetical protein
MFNTKKLWCVAIVALLFLLPNPALSTLSIITSGGEQLVYDDITQEYWQADLSRYTNKTLQEQLDIITADNTSLYGLINTWEMATEDQIEALFSSIPDETIASLFVPTTGPTFTLTQWQGRTITDSTSGPTLNHIPRLKLEGGVFSKLFPGQNRAKTASGNYGAWVKSVSPPILPIDIKPGSCPNPLNVKSKGVVPVAILGTEDFDVYQIDPASVRLEGAAPLRSALEDVATPLEPFTGKADCFEDCFVEGPDGYTDLTLKFKTQEVVDALGDVYDGDCLPLFLSGNLKAEFGGTPFEGEDVVLIIKGKLK